MRIGRIFALILSLLFLSNIVFSDNLFSRMRFTASNQYFAPLENTSFFIECNSDRNLPPIFPIKGKTFICYSDEKGECFQEICYGCPANSSVGIYAKYYSEEKKQVVEKWQGYYSEVALPGNCMNYKSPPSNDVEPFMFTVYVITVKIKDGNNESIINATIRANSPDAFYTECKTDGNGECRIKNIPENARYNIHAGFDGIENETVINVTQDTVIELALIKKQTEQPTVEENETIPVIPTTNLSNVSTPVENTTNQNYSSLSWFLYLMNKTDELIGKEKQKTPKLKLVFVPVNWDSNDLNNFNNSVEEQTNFFLDRYPIGNCREKVKIIKINQSCPILNWTCGKDSCNVNEMTADMDTIRKCASNALNILRIEDNMYIIGLTKDDVCGAVSGQSCRKKVMWSQTDDILVTSHELGHEFYLTEEYNSLRNGPPNQLSADYGCDPTNTTCCFATCIDDPPNVCCYGNSNSQGGRCIMSYSGAPEPRYFDPGDILFFNKGDLSVYPRLSQMRC